MFEQSESELGFFMAERHAAIGVSGFGFEGGSASVWDEARSNREHIARWWKDRKAVERERLIKPLFYALTPLAQIMTIAAWSTCSASSGVVSDFNSREFQAPLVGLALVAWCQMKPDDQRPAHAILSAWATMRTVTPSTISSVKQRALSLYEPIVAKYDEMRLARDLKLRTSRRERRELNDRQNHEFRLSLGAR